MKARAEYQVHQADEVILLNERGEVCEGTITNVFADVGDGVLVTPALACGLLPGVLRGELLDEGRASEAVLSPTIGCQAVRRQFAARTDPGTLADAGGMRCSYVSARTRKCARRGSTAAQAHSKATRPASS